MRAARARAAFQLKRVRAAATRTRASLARRGLLGTFRRIGDEFARKRGAPVPAPIIDAVPTPSGPDAPLQRFAVPTSAQPKASIVIPVYNKIEYTVACLRSLAEHAADAAFEVIVVDDGSSDATPAQLAQIAGIRALRNERNLGFIGSCNAGAAQARGEYVLFLNNDTVVTHRWLDALIACFAEEPDAGLVGAKLVYPDGRLQEAGGIVFRDGSGWNYGRFDDPNDPRYGYRREADYVSGAAIMLPRALFERLGGFDTRYAPAYYEDTDLAFAVRAAGKKVFYEPRAVVVHFEGVTSGTDTSGGIKRYQVVNREKFLDKWKDALARQPTPIHDAKQAPAAANFRDARRVLIIDSYTPRPDQDSGSLRMTNLMRLLREFGYRVSFLPENHAHEGRYTEALQALGVEALYHPFVADAGAWLRANGAELDVVVLSRHYVAAKYLGLVRLYARRAKVIFDTVDLHYLREQRTAQMQGSAELARQAAATRASETKMMDACDLTLVVSETEKALLAREAPGVPVAVVSNVHEVHGCRRAFAERAGLVFVGSFQHPPNVDAVLWFVREVFPLLRAQAKIELHVIGNGAPESIARLALDGVSVHGYVADLATFMDGCRISIAPLRVGAGVKGKVNMAMSYGLPVVATTTAVEGMHVEAGRDVLVADTAAEFAAAILRLYDDEALWSTLSANGLANVRSHFSFDAARAALKAILPR
ncbi:glycosyltransferase [Rudaea sp.]|uniref:glycosyltransferase n=1 Tax=Rudaea sp. TaxID=2136325 RepID=UPI0039E2B0FA